MSRWRQKRRPTWIGIVSISLLAIHATADRWVEFEAKYAEEIETCNPAHGKVENEALLTNNWSRGVITFKADGPGFHLEDGGLSMKFHWVRKVPGHLSISGRRLDGKAAPLRASIPKGYGEEGFQATGVVFSSPGCWEVTGSVAGQDLVFRVYVIKVPGPFKIFSVPDYLQYADL